MTCAGPKPTCRGATIKQGKGKVNGLVPKRVRNSRFRQVECVLWKYCTYVRAYGGRSDGDDRENGAGSRNQTEQVFGVWRSA